MEVTYVFHNKDWECHVQIDPQLHAVGFGRTRAKAWAMVQMLLARRDAAGLPDTCPQRDMVPGSSDVGTGT